MSLSSADGRLEAAPVSIVLAALVFALHASLFGGWIIDDAGISFAYSRNLAAGHGLVAQPGAVPVEGFSNLLWVLILAPFFALRVFHVVWTPKLIALVLSVGTMWVLYRSLARWAPGGSAVGLATLLLLAVQSAFVIWSVSGLENALYVFLLCVLLSGSMHAFLGGPPSRRRASGMAVVAAAAAATRPDGILYAFLWPSLVMLRSLRSRGRDRWEEMGPILWYGAVSSILVAGLVAFRIHYFGDRWPHAYHAKGGPSWDDALAVVLLRPFMRKQIVGLADAIAHPLPRCLIAASMAATLACCLGGSLRRAQVVLGAFLLMSTTAYLLLPEDWMRELRFATPFFVFAYGFLASLVWTVCRLFSDDAARLRRAFWLIIGLAILGTIAGTWPRSAHFARGPNVPLSTVAETYGTRYNRVASALGVDRGSFLLPDLGGTLLYSKLEVFDLAGLCDRVIARTLKKNLHAFHDYVFEEIRPTFIHVHGYWVERAKLDEDPRFRREYVALAERPERGGFGGDFVRKEVVEGKEEALQEARKQLSRPMTETPDPWID